MENPYLNRLWRDKNWPRDLPRTLHFTYEGLPLSGYLEKHSEKTPQKDAMIYYGRHISYAEFNDKANSFARFLHSAGIGKGDRVAVFLPTSPHFAIAYMGISKIGAVTTACSTAFKAMELVGQLKDSGSGILVCLDDYLDVVREALKKVKVEKLVVTGLRDLLDPDDLSEVPEHVNLDRLPQKDGIELLDIFRDFEPVSPSTEIDLENDIALFQYTGGTTGLPKGAIHTYFNVIYKAACRAGIAFYDLRDRIENIVTLQVAPVYHVAGLLQFNANLYEGLTQVFLSRFEPIRVLQAIEKYRPQFLATLTKMNMALLEAPDSEKYDLTSVQKNLISSVGIPLSKKVADAWRRRIAPGARVGETAYGLTETHTGDTFMPLDRPAGFGDLSGIGCGIPIYGTEFKIVSLNDRDEILPVGEMGEIAIKGPANFKGYWNRPQETADTLRDGWLYTGDTGRFDNDGFFYWMGRKKEMIKVSGYSVFPDEVEMFLNTHPAVDCTGVTGLPDKNKGMVIKAVVVLKEPFKGKVSSEDIIAWAKEKISFYKVPKVLEIRDALPRSGTAKIMRRYL